MNKYLITIVVFIAIIASAFTLSSRNNPTKSTVNTNYSISTTTGTQDQKSTSTTLNQNTVKNPTTTIKPTPTPKPAPTPTEPSMKSYTMADISTHNNSSSCWTAINGNVYDVTSYISRHPGGERNILRICGADGSSLFEGQHGGDSRPESILSTFIIGILK